MLDFIEVGRDMKHVVAMRCVCEIVVFQSVIDWTELRVGDDDCIDSMSWRSTPVSERQVPLGGVVLL